MGRPGWPGAASFGYLGGAALVALVSFIDDWKSLPRLPRLITHVAAALWLILSCGAGARVSVYVPVLGSIDLGSMALPVLVLWVVGLLNAYNFMDGIDGLAGLQALVGGVVWVLIGARFALPGHGALGLLLAAASTGFLLHNLPRARIFLGDVGSAFLGFTFAALSVSVASNDDSGTLLLGTALTFWPLIFDTVSTLLTRLIKGQNVLEPHRRHLYQRLVDSGFSHVAVALLYAGLSLMGALSGLLLQFRAPVFDAAVVVSLTSLALLLVSLVRRAERERARAS
jgi:UDP-N-acetylmuramyl pentapeptide phosphotransferase/UDP-N-acetylglucosamine-1-phosphate transferase